ncbi:hypothetical protein MBANPS3_006969 [Mucor bainieri]
MTIIHLKLDTTTIHNSGGTLAVTYELEHDGSSQKHLTMTIDGLPVECIQDKLLQLCMSYPAIDNSPVIWSSPDVGDTTTTHTLNEPYAAYNADTDASEDCDDGYYESLPAWQSSLIHASFHDDDEDYANNDDSHDMEHQEESISRCLQNEDPLESIHPRSGDEQSTLLCTLAASSMATNLPNVHHCLVVTDPSLCINNRDIENCIVIDDALSDGDTGTDDESWRESATILMAQQHDVSDASSRGDVIHGGEARRVQHAADNVCDGGPSRRGVHAAHLQRQQAFLFDDSGDDGDMWDPQSIPSGSGVADATAHVEKDTNSVIDLTHSEDEDHQQASLFSISSANVQLESATVSMKRSRTHRQNKADSRLSNLDSLAKRRKLAQRPTIETNGRRNEEGASSSTGTAGSKTAGEKTIMISSARAASSSVELNLLFNQCMISPSRSYTSKVSKEKRTHN